MERYKPVQTILLVESDRTIRGALHNFLEAKGLNLIEAQDNAEALLIAECYPKTIHVLAGEFTDDAEFFGRFTAIRPTMQVVHAPPKSVHPEELLAQIQSVLASPDPLRSVTYLAHEGIQEAVEKVHAAGV